MSPTRAISAIYKKWFKIVYDFFMYEALSETKAKTASKSIFTLIIHYNTAPETVSNLTLSKITVSINLELESHFKSYFLKII